MIAKAHFDEQHRAIQRHHSFGHTDYDVARLMPELSIMEIRFRREQLGLLPRYPQKDDLLARDRDHNGDGDAMSTEEAHARVCAAYLGWPGFGYIEALAMCACSAFVQPMWFEGLAESCTEIARTHQMILVDHLTYVDYKRPLRDLVRDGFLRRYGLRNDQARFALTSLSWARITARRLKRARKDQKARPEDFPRHPHRVQGGRFYRRPATQQEAPDEG